MFVLNGPLVHPHANPIGEMVLGTVPSRRGWLLLNIARAWLHLVHWPLRDRAGTPLFPRIRARSGCIAWSVSGASAILRGGPAERGPEAMNLAKEAAIPARSCPAKFRRVRKNLGLSAWDLDGGRS